MLLCMVWLCDVLSLSQSIIVSLSAPTTSDNVPVTRYDDPMYTMQSENYVRMSCIVLYIYIYISMTPFFTELDKNDEATDKFVIFEVLVTLAFLVTYLITALIVLCVACKCGSTLKSSRYTHI